MPTSLEAQRQQAVWYAECLLTQGTFYFWGGDDPSGRDCSGVVVECLQGAGTLPHGKDYSADALYIKYLPKKVTTPKAGCLKFWLRWSDELNRLKAIHVEIFRNSHFLIGASGGGRPQFDLSAEIQKCPLLRSIFLSNLITGKIELEKLRGTFFLNFVERELLIQQAIKQNAFIKSRPHTYRSGESAIVDPFLE